jgi:hypothetical protein
MAKKIDPAKEKAKRQKTIAIVGGVILLALLAFQLPRTMKMLKSPGNVTTNASTTSASTTTPGSTPLAPPTLEGGAAGSTSAADGATVTADTSSDGVRDPGTPLPADAGQLVSFSRFKSKDPFKQQVTACGAEQCSTSPSSSAGAATTDTTPPASTSGGGSGSSAGGSSAGGSKPAAVKPAPAAPVTTAVVSVNGVAESVGVGKTFPAADPVFVLVKATRTSVTISVAGGSLESGAPAVRLQTGKTVTLQNTADGTQYVLKLLRTV